MEPSVISSNYDAAVLRVVESTASTEIGVLQILGTLLRRDDHFREDGLGAFSLGSDGGWHGQRGEMAPIASRRLWCADVDVSCCGVDC